MFKKLAAALIAVSTIIPAAKAETQLDHTAIAAHLHLIGVTTQYGDCGSSTHGSRLGSYNATTNHLCISDSITTTSLLDETVLHELTHVIQDCISSGIAGENMSSITGFLSNNDEVKEKEMDKAILSKLIDEDKMLHVDRWASDLGTAQFIEREAYAFETEPKLVLSLLSKCMPTD